MKNFWQELHKPFFVLAPMAGVTDQPFRLMCKKFTADVLYSEMVSSEAIWHNRLNSKFKTLNPKQIRNYNYQNNKQLLKTLELIRFSKIERPFVVQIFGSNPEHMAYAAEYIATGEWYKDYQKIRNLNFETRNNIKNIISNDKKYFGFCASDFEILSIPNGIDINMGCPARDVVKTGAGSALIKNQENAIKIIKAIKKKVKNIPVSVKTRLGWSNPDEILEFSKKLENAGVNAIAIHGRTYKQKFSGKADWSNIYKVKKMLKIPVIGNGGIVNFEDVGNVRYVQIVQKLQLQQVKRLNNFNNLNIPLDGIMIGQGALGKPWLFEELKKQFLISKSEILNNDLNSNNNKNKIINNPKAKIQKLKTIILQHAKLVDKFKGQEGFKEFRKHFAWYFKDQPNSKKIRSKLNQINSLDDVKDILKN